MSIRQLIGDCRATLPTLAENSIQTCITSPPYYGLRSYLSDDDPMKAYEIGLESTPDAYITKMIEVFRSVRRVLRADGTLWLNLGDSYAGSHGNGYKQSLDKVNRTSGQHGNFDLSRQIKRVDGVKPKNLLMIPFRVAMALQQDGWNLRSVVPWVRRNGFPESVKDRPVNAIEYVFFLSKSGNCYYDRESIRMPGHYRRNSEWFFETWQGLLSDIDGDPSALIVNTSGFSDAHFATFPPKLVEPMIKSSARENDTVLDCFGGSGTVGLVADRLGRNAVLCELKDEYTGMAQRRVVGDAPLFAEWDVA